MVQVTLDKNKKLNEIKKQGEKKLKKEEEPEEDYENTAPYSVTNNKKLPIYSKPETYSISRTLIEVYKTDEENWEQYVPNGGETKEEEKEETEDEETEEETEEEEEEEEGSDLKGFKLHQGEILETYYYGKFSELSYEGDYTEITNNANLKTPEIKDLDRFYKGVRLCIRKKWEKQGETLDLEDYIEVFKGYITEESFAQSGMSLTLAGMTKTLEQKYKFSFTQMKRSDIIKEVIKTAGLKPVVNPEGLQDDVIDYTNISSTGDGDDSGSGADSDSTDLNKLVKNAIKGKKGKKEKAEAVHNALRDSCIKYRKYNNFQYKTVKDCWEHRQSPGLNCGDTSQLTVGAMKIAGLKAETLLTHDSAHYITRIEGQWFSDLVWSEGACSKRPFDATWRNYRSGSVHPSPSG